MFRLWQKAEISVLGRYWHKADIDGDGPDCPLSGAKQTFRKKAADVRF
jgi:hypothetical protein